MDSFNPKEQSVEKPSGRPILERISRMKAVLQGCRVSLDEELQPLGITTAQMRMLWSIAENPEVSGAKIARLCSVTPQSGQAMLATMEAHGWVKRRPSATNHRVLVAELTNKGLSLLTKARELALALDLRLWEGFDAEELAVVDSVLKAVVKKLER